MGDFYSKRGRKREKKKNKEGLINECLERFFIE